MIDDFTDWSHNLFWEFITWSKSCKDKKFCKKMTYFNLIGSSALDISIHLSYLPLVVQTHKKHNARQVSYIF